MDGLRRLSAEEVMKVARERFVQLSSQQGIDLSMLKHFFDATQFGLSGEDIKDVELALLLIASAHKFSHQQFDQAIKFLNLCDFLSNRTGNSVQRAVQYFSRALRERIDRETGGIPLQLLENIEFGRVLHPEEAAVTSNPALISCSLQLPHVQVTQFAGIQALTESLASAKKVHFVDLAIRSGGHCTALMQALANRHECPVELLRITAVGTRLKEKMEETGIRLACFAESLKIPFSFKAVTVANIKDLKEDMFELMDGEAVAIYSEIMMRYLKAQPDCLESLMKVLTNLKPCVMVIIEFEADHSSPVFIDRFLEALLFYSTNFDCLEARMDRWDPNRMAYEVCLGEEIRDIIVAKEHDRAFRSMKIEDWRTHLTGFGMLEMELSSSCFYQAELVVKNFACGDSCTVDRNGKCLVSGWKGTPILCVSAWKFHQQEQPRRSCMKKLKSF